MRARSWALSDAFPDVLKGVGIREETADQPLNRGTAERVDDEQTQKVRRELKNKSDEVKQKALEQLKADQLHQVIEAIEGVTTLDALNKTAALIDELADDQDRDTAQNHWTAKQSALKKKTAN